MNAYLSQGLAFLGVALLPLYQILNVLCGCICHCKVCHLSLDSESTTHSNTGHPALKVQHHKVTTLLQVTKALKVHCHKVGHQALGLQHHKVGQLAGAVQKVKIC